MFVSFLLYIFKAVIGIFFLRRLVRKSVIVMLCGFLHFFFLVLGIGGGVTTKLEMKNIFNTLRDVRVFYFIYFMQLLNFFFCGI